MPDSFGCRRCYGEDPRAAWAYYEEGLAVERELVGDSHFLVQLRRCADCGQQFVWIFGEAVDWQGGDDAQRREIVPVSATEAEAAGRLDYPSLAALGVGPALPRNRLAHRCGKRLRRVVDGRASAATKSASLGRSRRRRLAPQQSPFALGSSSPRARGARWWVAGSRPESKSAGPVRSVYARRASAGVKPSRSPPTHRQAVQILSHSVTEALRRPSCLAAIPLQ